MHFRKLKITGNKGQIGESLTWTVATVSILVMVFIFLFVVATIEKAEQSVEYWEQTETDYATQQTAFALLGKEAGSADVKELLMSGDYGSARSEIDVALTYFSSKGMNCNFYVNELGSEVLRVEKGGDGKKIGVLLGADKEVVLQC